MIPQTFIDEVQSRTDIAQVISDYIPLKRAGRNFKALCPFHGEKTPSFMISPQKQIFHCFGCGEGGGAIQFVMLMEKVTFPEAIEILAKRLGLAIPYQKGKNQQEKTVLYAAMDKAGQFYSKLLLSDPKAQNVREYLKKRGIADATIKKFLIGYAPGNNLLLNFLRKQNFTLANLEKVSLVNGSRGGYRDLFIRRITFPIFDVRSRVVGFGGRLVSGQPNAPKYLNSLEGPLYSKRAHLYGLNFAKEEISKQRLAIVVEGYLDVIIPFMRGVKNIVASLGTALTEEQIRLLKRYTNSVVLVYDSDKAGQTAALRSIDLLLENQVEVSVAQLPEGYDPDSLVRKKGNEAFMRLIEERKDFFDYKLELLKKSYDIQSIEGKTKISKELFKTLEKLNSEMEKYEYIKRLSSQLEVKEEIMIADFKNATSVGKKTSKFSYQKTASKIQQEYLPVQEKVLIKSMLVNEKAFEAIKKRLRVEYFTSSLAKRAFKNLLAIDIDTKGHSAQKLIGSIEDKEVSSFLSKIAFDDEILLDNLTFKASFSKLEREGKRRLQQQIKDQLKQEGQKGFGQKCKELIKEHLKINSEVRNG